MGVGEYGDLSIWMYAGNGAFVYGVIGGFEQKRMLPSIEVLAIVVLNSGELMEFNKWVKFVCDVCEYMYDRWNGMFVISNEFDGGGGFGKLMKGGLIDIDADAYDRLGDVLLFYDIFNEYAGNFFIALLSVYEEVVGPFDADNICWYA